MKWASTFKYLRINYGEKIAQIEDSTQVVSFINNICGEKIRIRFSNRFSKNRLTIEHALLKRISENNDDICVFVTLNCNKRIVIEPDEELFSDEIPLEVKAGDKLEISLYFKEKHDIDAVCCYWSVGGTFAGVYDGDSSNDKENRGFDITADYVKEADSTMSMFVGFNAVQVFTGDETKVVAAFGDSITHMSFYTDALYKKICRECPGKASLINSGIGGNRLVDDATFVKEAGKQLIMFGEAGEKRFEKDVFELDEVDAVCMLIGINDIMHPIQLEGKEETTGAKEIIDGYKKVIACAHDNGAEIYVGTITPCGNNDYPDEWMKKFDRTRNEVNAWIRKCELHDGVMDFDRAIMSDDKPSFIKEGCHIGDGLHPNGLGGEKMAEVIDLRTIIGLRRSRN